MLSRSLFEDKNQVSGIAWTVTPFGTQEGACSNTDQQKTQSILSFSSAKEFGTKQLFAVWCLAVLGLIFNKPR